MMEQKVRYAKKSLGMNVLVLVVAICVALCLFEEVLRFFNYHYSPFKISPDWRLYHALIDENYLYDPLLIWRPKANQGPFNQQGFIGLELPKTKQPQEYRIFTLGDSNTEGPWPLNLQKLFWLHRMPVTVTNAGVTGYASYQGLQRLKDILQYQPDMVLVCFGANDAHRVKQSDLQYSQQFIRRIKLDQALTRWKIGQLILAIADICSSWWKQDMMPRVSPEEYRANLEEMIRIAHSHNAQVVLLTRPFAGETSNVNIWKTYAHIYNRITREVAQENQLPFIDLYGNFRYQSDYFLDEAHFTAEGHEVAAEYIFQAIKDKVQLAVPTGKAVVASEVIGE
jgi:lysophospholipase L1-like esterase